MRNRIIVCLCFLFSVALYKPAHANVRLVINGEDIGTLYQGIYNWIRIDKGRIDSIDMKLVKYLKKDTQAVRFMILKKDIKQLKVYLRDEQGRPLSVWLPVETYAKLPKPNLYFCNRSADGKCLLEDLSNNIIVKNPVSLIENQNLLKYSVQEYHMIVYRKGRIIYEDDYRKRGLSLGGESIRKILRIISADDVVEFSQVHIEDHFGNTYRFASWIIRAGKTGWTGF